MFESSTFWRGHSNYFLPNKCAKIKTVIHKGVVVLSGIFISTCGWFVWPIENTLHFFFGTHTCYIYYKSWLVHKNKSKGHFSICKNFYNVSNVIKSNIFCFVYIHTYTYIQNIRICISLIVFQINKFPFWKINILMANCKLTLVFIIFGN